MAISFEENALVEQSAKLQALQELLEYDLSETNTTQATLSNMQDNHPAYKQLYLETKVAYSKYKSRFVPKTLSEDEFNSDPNRTFNDVWIQKTKKTFQKVNMDVVDFLNRASTIAKHSSSQEQKLDVTEKEEFSRISSKIDLEFKNLRSEIEETIKLVKDTKSLNPNQAQIYTGYQQSMCQVLDEKLPTLLKQLSSLATPDDRN